MSSMFERWKRSSTPLQNGWGSCFRKGAYKTQEIADTYKAKSEARQPGLVLYTYHCEVCKKFHLTKQSQAERKK